MLFLASDSWKETGDRSEQESGWQMRGESSEKQQLIQNLKVLLFFSFCSINYRQKKNEATGCEETNWPALPQRSEGLYPPCQPYAGLGCARMLTNVDLAGKPWMHLCYFPNWSGFRVRPFEPQQQCGTLPHHSQRLLHNAMLSMTILDPIAGYIWISCFPLFKRGSCFAVGSQLNTKILCIITLTTNTY